MWDLQVDRPLPNSSLVINLQVLFQVKSQVFIALQVEHIVTVDITTVLCIHIDTFVNKDCKFCIHVPCTQYMTIVHVYIILLKAEFITMLVRYMI